MTLIVPLLLTMPRRSAHKQCKNWRVILKPDSQFHVQRNVGALKDHVKKVATFMQDMQHKFPRDFSLKDVSADLAIAVRGIVTKPAPPKPIELPTLNTDDAYYCYDEM